MRHALLALLADAPAHGYELKQELETTFGDAWPPTNIGQIYTTLGRLERDQFVTCTIVRQDGRPDKKTYAITDAGRAELHRWLTEPETSPRLRDDLFMRVILARNTGGDADTDVLTIIARQRALFLQTMRDYDTLLLEQDPANPGATLLIEAALLHIEADLRWLDLCESRALQRSKEAGR